MQLGLCQNQEDMVGLLLIQIQHLSLHPGFLQNLNREISKLNYRIHTDAIKSNLLPPDLTKEQISFTYASEADILNVALFGKTAKQWREENTDKK